jgi:hypothetical protein
MLQKVKGEKVMKKDIVISIRIDREVWRKARIYAIENDKTMKELIETLLKKELKEKRIRQKNV